MATFTGTPGGNLPPALPTARSTGGRGARPALLLLRALGLLLPMQVSAAVALPAASAGPATAKSLHLVVDQASAARPLTVPRGPALRKGIERDNLGAGAAGTSAADDKDGVGGSSDACMSTPPGAQADADGCSIGQLCPCRPGSDGWPNQRAYLSCIAGAAQEFIDLGLIAWTEQKAILARAGRSQCGKKG